MNVRPERPDVDRPRQPTVIVGTERAKIGVRDGSHRHRRARRETGETQNVVALTEELGEKRLRRGQPGTAVSPHWHTFTPAFPDEKGE